jgi:hypothetical protein
LEWNGKSILAGNVLTGDKRNISSEALYTTGFDVVAFRSLTLALDLLGQKLFNMERLVNIAAGTSNNPAAGFGMGPIPIVNGSAGFKLNPVGQLVIAANLIFRLNEAGLRGRVVPMVSLSYGF